MWREKSEGSFERFHPNDTRSRAASHLDRLSAMAAAEIEYVARLAEIDCGKDGLLQRALAAAQGGVFLGRCISGEERADPREIRLGCRHQAKGEMAFTAIGAGFVVSRGLRKLVVEAGDLDVAHLRCSAFDRNGSMFVAS